MLVGSMAGFLLSPQAAAIGLMLQWHDPLAITRYRLAQLSAQDYEAAVRASLAAGDQGEARALVELAAGEGHTLPASLVAQTEADATMSLMLEFFEGARSGAATSPATLAGAMAADLTGIGDVRDTVVQGTRLVRGEDHDALILGLSLVGLAATVPAAGVVDAGASLIKSAHKAGRLSPGLRSRVAGISADLVDRQALGQALQSGALMPEFRLPSASALRTAMSVDAVAAVGRGDLAPLQTLLREAVPFDSTRARQALRGVVRPHAVEELGQLLDATRAVAAAGGTRATLLALRHADSAGDLARFGKVAEGMGEQSGAVIRILGKNAVRLGELAWLLVSLALGTLGWLAGALWFVWSAGRSLRRGW
jgi:hypothetical protein